MATRKPGIDGAIAQALVDRLIRLSVVVVDAPLVASAISGSLAGGISHWDALIIRV